jgi:hypothetical protein
MAVGDHLRWPAAAHKRPLVGLPYLDPTPQPPMRKRAGEARRRVYTEVQVGIARPGPLPSSATATATRWRRCVSSGSLADCR